MARKLVLAIVCVSVFSVGCRSVDALYCKTTGYKSLFDGKTLYGWKASENKDTFSVRDGMIVAHGPRSHLFYVGPVNNADFKNFEFKADVMTEVGSNSGIYFHTTYQKEGWPGLGFEVQVNNTHTDPKKTGSLYNVKDANHQSRAFDYEWFTEHIIVKDKHVTIKVNGHTVVEWTQPEDWKGPQGSSGRIGRVLSSGTFALQGHDPNSIVCFKNIMVKPLP
jgi:hypothetical protein